VVLTDGAAVDADLIIYVPPIVRVDRHTMATAFPGVYAVGDVTLIPLAMGKPLPRAGVFAHVQAEAVAGNVAAAVASKPATARFDGQGACFIETGAGAAGFGSGYFYAGPRPVVRTRRPGAFWHLGKVLFEKQVMWGWL
jgi:sulfide:quinone oxidoreductase